MKLAGRFFNGDVLVKSYCVVGRNGRIESCATENRAKQVQNKYRTMGGAWIHEQPVVLSTWKVLRESEKKLIDMGI